MEHCQYRTYLGHDTSLNKFKRIELKVCSLDRNGNELEINNREIKEKSPSSWKLNRRLLNNLLGKRGSLRGI